MSSELFISKINERISDALEAIPNKQIFGLCQSVIKGEGTTAPMMPCEVNKDGEGKYVGIDNLRSIILYHKSNTLLVTERAGTGYGDLRADKVYSYSNSMIVFYNRRILKYLPDELALILEANLQDGLKITNYKTVNIRFQNIVLNAQQVFAGEYKNVAYRIPPNCNLFAINYQIESQFSKNCFATCP